MNNTNQYKILLADDEPQNIRVLFEVSDSEEYRVFVASNGKSVVEQAIKHQPNAIIMDWDIPEMNGIEVIKIIRANNAIKDIPIIVATCKMTSVENLSTALETGANDSVRKPFDPIEIQARVKSMIRLQMEQQKIVRLEK
jgi:DNA-binding response OmpR family regulator